MTSYMLAEEANRTACSGDTQQDYATGFVAVIIAVAFFGTNFVPVKKFETGDGMFFQWVMCSAIWIVGLLVNAYQGWPSFQPGAMLGGFLWATGNIMSVPIIKMIGISMGLLIWGSSNMLMGWLSGTLGILGVESQSDSIVTPWMNYSGVALALISLTLYSQIEVNTAKKKSSSSGLAELANGDANHHDYKRLASHTTNDDYASITIVSPRMVGNELDVDQRGIASTPLDSNGSANIHDKGMADALLDGVQLDPNDTKLRLDTPASVLDRLPKGQKRLIGVTMAVVAGLLFGTSFNPVQYLRDKVEYADEEGCPALNYVFSHFSGIFLSSTAYFMIYCAATKNRPQVYPRVILPSFISGLMWAIANTSWFVANEKLEFPVSFPLITTGPGFISMFWGICLFGEVTGQRNFTVLGIAATIAVIGVTLIALSQVNF